MGRVIRGVRVGVGEENRTGLSLYTRWLDVERDFERGGVVGTMLMRFGNDEC